MAGRRIQPGEEVEIVAIHVASAHFTRTKSDSLVGKRGIVEDIKTGVPVHGYCGVKLIGTTFSRTLGYIYIYGAKIKRVKKGETE